MGYYDLILHADSADPAILKMVIRNANNYLNALSSENFALIIVANAGAVKLLTNERQDLHELALPVLNRGVNLRVCANALAENHLTKENIWPQCQVVPAGLVEIARLQREGFAYIKP